MSEHRETDGPSADIEGDADVDELAISWFFMPPFDQGARKFLERRRRELQRRRPMGRVGGSWRAAHLDGAQRR